MKAYPVPLRLLLLDAIDHGMRPNHAARVFGVSVSTVKRYVAQRRVTGDLAPKSYPGRPPVILRTQHDRLLALVADHPAATLEAYCRWWQAGGGTLVSIATMSRTLQRLGVTHQPASGGR